jgi:hypothetical protein
MLNISGMNPKLLSTVAPHSQQKGTLEFPVPDVTVGSFVPLRASPRIIVVCLPILAVLVAALASTGTPQYVSTLIAASWAVLIPGSLFNAWAARFLPVISGAFVVLAIFALPFNSPAFIADIWAALSMCLVTLPRQQ